MRRRSSAFLVTALMFSCAGGPFGTGGLADSPAPSVSPTSAEQAYLPIGEFSTTRAFHHVRKLAGRIGPRPAGSGKYRRAARYARVTFSDLGYQTDRMRFALPGGGKSWNVVASWPEGPEPTMVIGGHLDTVQGSPGGNDNASGVATILETARVLAGTEEVQGLVLIAFGAEEIQPLGGHHYGSAAYVDSLSAGERDRLDAMISVDMIGKARPYVVGRLGGTSRSAAQMVAAAARRVDLKARIREVGDISDHGPFAMAGVPAALLWTGYEPNHHQPGDVVGNVQRGALRNGGAVLISLLEHAA